MQGDNKLYKFECTRGLPVYLETEVVHGHRASLEDAAYGTKAFKELTKLESRVVLRFLKLGNNAAWSDADVLWF